jgi:hypothetical protein
VGLVTKQTKARKLVMLVHALAVVLSDWPHLLNKKINDNQKKKEPNLN